MCTTSWETRPRRHCSPCFSRPPRPRSPQLIRQRHLDSLEQREMSALTVLGLVITPPSAVNMIRRGLGNHQVLRRIHVNELIENTHGDELPAKIGNPPLIAVSPDFGGGYSSARHELRRIRRNGCPHPLLRDDLHALPVAEVRVQDP